ncbi:hypothetical protein [Haladaptatus litoreus]|uniref:hypothetical protein n=1 Tax=Haladaptatus litoreus TaxID=553468 RepID=UPI00158F0CB7|nr:hypothetical protein [Haladaptatus litoreus]
MPARAAWKIRISWICVNFVDLRDSPGARERSDSCEGRLNERKRVKESVGEDGVCEGGLIGVGSCQNTK